MAHINDTTELTEVLQEISESGNPLLAMLRMICQEMMELEVNQQLHADRCQRTEERTISFNLPQGLPAVCCAERLYFDRMLRK